MSIEQQLEQAQQAAETAIVASNSHQPPAVAQTMNADAFMNQVNSADGYLKLAGSGMSACKEKVKKASFKATIVPSQIRFSNAIRYSQGTRTVYEHTYDGVTNSNGKSWAAVIATAEAITGAEVRTYPSAELLFTLVEDLNSKAKTGNTLAYATPYTGNPAVAGLIAAMKEDGITDVSSYTDPVNVVVGYDIAASPHGQEYALLTLDYTGK